MSKISRPNLKSAVLKSVLTFRSMSDGDLSSLARAARETEKTPAPARARPTAPRTGMRETVIKVPKRKQRRECEAQKSKTVNTGGWRGMGAA